MCFPPDPHASAAGYTVGGRIGRMGGESLLGFNKATRAAAGVEAGDEITIDVILDETPREVQVPDDEASDRDGRWRPRRQDALGASASVAR